MAAVMSLPAKPKGKQDLSRFYKMFAAKRNVGCPWIDGEECTPSAGCPTCTVAGISYACEYVQKSVKPDIWQYECVEE
ncbi:hypothetical protein ACROYT_G010213 [Oculina patagonica]